MTTSSRMPAPPGAGLPSGWSGARPLTALMVLAVALVAALAFWDHQRESAAALDDFAQDQATLAGSVLS